MSSERERRDRERKINNGYVKKLLACVKRVVVSPCTIIQ